MLYFSIETKYFNENLKILTFLPRIYLVKVMILSASNLFGRKKKKKKKKIYIYIIYIYILYTMK